MQWDIFCRVIDNFGDIGVCWRLAADLSLRGEQVHLWCDDTSALAWMAPQGQSGVAVFAWSQAETTFTPGDVVIEAFGCELPQAVVVGMAQAKQPPAWINLEYLSAEPYVARCHGLHSPQLSGLGSGLSKWFFYPGFTPDTGGLIRELGLVQAQTHFDRVAWLSSLGIELLPSERLVSLFGYNNPAPRSLLNALSESPTLLLALAGTSVPATTNPQLRVQALPHLSQAKFDQLLYSCDLNFVRGEDSFVRAHWAGQPFVWQIYPQSDDAHVIKLQAFLKLFLNGMPTDQAQHMHQLWLAWNGQMPWPTQLPHLPEWKLHCEKWRAQLQGQPDLVSALMAFVKRVIA
jgi:uncharacterized repeat protein (TIGR03837 family)